MVLKASDYKKKLKSMGYTKLPTSTKLLSQMYEQLSYLKSQNAPMPSPKKATWKEVNKYYSREKSRVKNAQEQIKTQNYTNEQWVAENLADTTTGLVYLRGSRDTETGQRDIVAVNPGKFSRLYEERYRKDYSVINKNEYESYKVKNEKAWSNYREETKESEAKEKQIQQVQEQLKASGYSGTREQAESTIIVSPETLQELKDVQQVKQDKVAGTTTTLTKAPSETVKNWDSLSPTVQNKLTAQTQAEEEQRYSLAQAKTVPTAVQELAIRANTPIVYENKRIEEENKKIEEQNKQALDLKQQQMRDDLANKVNEYNQKVEAYKEKIEEKKQPQAMVSTTLPSTTPPNLLLGPVYAPKTKSSQETQDMMIDYQGEQAQISKQQAMDSLMSKTIPSGQITTDYDKEKPLTGLEKMQLKEQASAISWTNPIEKLRAYTSNTLAFSSSREAELKQQTGYNQINEGLSKSYSLTTSSESIAPTQYKAKLEEYTQSSPLGASGSAAKTVGTLGIAYTKGVKGVFNVANSILHPLQTAKGTAQAVLSPVETIKTAGTTVVKDPLSIIEFGTEAYLTGKIGSAAFSGTKNLMAKFSSEGTYSPTTSTSAPNNFLKSEGYIVEQVSKLDRYGNVYEGFDIKKTIPEGQKTLSGESTAVKETYTTSSGKSTYPDTYKGINKALKVEVSGDTSSGLKTVSNVERPMYSKELQIYQTGWEVEGVYFDVEKGKFVDINQKTVQQTLGKGNKYKVIDSKTGKYKTIYDSDISIEMNQVFVKDSGKVRWADEYKGWIKENKNLAAENLERKYGKLEIVDNRIKQTKLSDDILGKSKAKENFIKKLEEKPPKRKIKIEEKPKSNFEMLDELENDYQKSKTVQKTKTKTKQDLINEKMEAYKGSVRVEPKLKRYTTKELSTLVETEYVAKSRGFKPISGLSKLSAFAGGALISTAKPKNMFVTQKSKLGLQQGSIMSLKPIQTLKPLQSQLQLQNIKPLEDIRQKQKLKQIQKTKQIQELVVIPSYDTQIKLAQAQEQKQRNKQKQVEVTPEIVVPPVIPIVPIIETRGGGRPPVIPIEKKTTYIKPFDFQLPDYSGTRYGRTKGIKEWTITNKVWMPRLKGWF